MRRKQLASLLLSLLPLLSACASPPAPSVTDTPKVARGRELATRYCGSCHAVGQRDKSPDRQAPAFRTLSDRYPVSDLAESLAEGIVSGHEEMPEFRFPSNDVKAFIAYLEAIQTHPRKDETDLE